MHPQNTQREESCNQVPWGVCAFSGWGTWEPVCVLPWCLPSGEGVCLGGCAPISTWVMMYVCEYECDSLRVCTIRKEMCETVCACNVYTQVRVCEPACGLTGRTWMTGQMTSHVCV